MTDLRITTAKEDEFLATLRLLGTERKLILGRPVGNRLTPSGEIRKMATLGGFQFGLADIDMIGRRGSGRYTTDIETAYLWAIDMEIREKRWDSRNGMTPASWFVVSDVEHVPDTEY